MLRPLEPIQWTLPVILARARDVTKRDRPLTLRQALRVLAKHGRRKMRGLAKRVRWNYLVNCVTAAIHLRMNLRDIKRGWSAVEQAMDWARGPNVTVERIHRSLLDQAMHYRITTTHLANPVTVELGVLGEDNPGCIKIVMYPLRRSTHLRFVGDNNQPVEFPRNNDVLARIGLDTPLRGIGLGLYFLLGTVRIARGRHERVLHATYSPTSARLKVILRNLLNLGGEQEEPLTPA